MTLAIILWVCAIVFLYCLFKAGECANGDEAVQLNLRIRGKCIVADINSVSNGSIAPTTAAGTSAPVSNVVWSTVPDGVYSVAPAADGLSAVYTAVGAGSAVASVSAVSKGGVTLTESKPLPDVVVDQEAVALNLSIA